jgi:HEAT repeat protein
MKNIFLISVFLIVIDLLSAPASGQPQIPKEEIPTNIASDVKEQIEMLYSHNAIERGHAAHCLGRMKEKAVPAIPFLIEILDNETKLQWQKQWEGMKIPGRATSPSREAADALGKIGEPAVEPLIEALKDKDPTVRKRVAEALMKIGDARAVMPLNAALKDEDAGVRTRAAIALTMAGHTSEVELDPLIDGLKDENEFFIPFHIPAKAAEALIKIGDTRAVEPLIGVLNKDSIDLRFKAAEALGKIGDARAVEPLIEALKDKQPTVRKRAAESLGEIRDTRAVEPLIDALKDKWIRCQAAEALGEIGDTRAVEPLIEAFIKEPGIRLWAADALRSIGDARAVVPFIDALKDEKLAVRVRAQLALSEITGQDFGDEPLKWREWWDKNKEEMLKER